MSACRGGGVCYKSCGVFLAGHPARPSRCVQKLVYVRNLFSSILCVRICDRSTQFLVNCFEKFLWQQTIADLIQPTCFLVSEERRGFMWKIYAVSETCLLIAEADRVLCHLVVFLPVFMHWIYLKMKYSCYQNSFFILGWLVYWAADEKCTAQQKEIGNHRFQK